MRIDTQARQPAPDAAGSRPQPREQPRLPQPAAREHGQAGDRATDGDLPQEQGRDADELTKAQIRDGNNGAKLATLNTAQRNALLTNTPLWFYILREAELNAGKLGGVGARIVAETFHRAIEGSHFSIVRDTAFRPSLGPNNTTFRMVDLLFFAFNGNPALLNPNGN